MILSHRERVAVLETMIQRVASGAPIVVANASAMTDTDQIYVLSTDGMWYYHNGSAWVAGGTYGAVATDITLTKTGSAADAKKVGDEFTQLKNQIQLEQKNTYVVPTSYTYIVNAGSWTMGSGVRPSDGTNQTTDKQCRTTYNTIKGRTLLYIDDPAYDFVIWEYRDTSVSSAVFSPTNMAFVDYPIIITEEQEATKFRLGVRRKDNAVITSADITTLTTAVKTFLLTDDTLTIKGSPADAKKVGEELTDVKARASNLEKFQSDAENAIKGALLSEANSALWEIGSFNSATGTEYPSETSKALRTKTKMQNLCAVKTTTDYMFGLYAWAEDGIYIGTLQENGTYSATSPHYMTEIVLDPTNGNSYRLLLKKANGSAFEDATAGGDVIISTSLPYKNKQDIEDIQQDIEDIQQEIAPILFPADGKKPDAVSFYESFDELADWETITEGQFFEYGVISGGYVDEHIADYQNYELRAYYLNGRMEYMGYNGAGQTPSTNYYKLLSPYTDDQNAEAVGTSLYTRKKVLITAGMHGDEGATPNILREFVRELINNPKYADILTSYQFCFIPLANPYGYSIERRHCRYYDSVTGNIETKDMNGDFPQDGTEQILSESKFVKQIFLDGEYDIVFDLHQHNFDTDIGTTTNKLAFGGITLKPQSTLDAEKYYRIISGESIYAQNMIRSVFNIEDNVQTMFAWDRDTTHSNTFREYAVGTRDTSARHKAEMAAISETSPCCFIYSNTHTKYNQLAMTVCKEYDTAFIAGILRKFVEE